MSFISAPLGWWADFTRCITFLIVSLRILFLRHHWSLNNFFAHFEIGFFLLLLTTTAFLLSAHEFYLLHRVHLLRVLVLILVLVIKLLLFCVLVFRLYLLLYELLLFDVIVLKKQVEVIIHRSFPQTLLRSISIRLFLGALLQERVKGIVKVLLHLDHAGRLTLALHGS